MLPLRLLLSNNSCLYSRQLIERASIFNNSPIIFKTHLHLLHLVNSPSALNLTPARTAHTSKISSPRLQQIARHFSSSSTSTIDPSHNTTNAKMASQYKVRKIGAPNTLEHRIFIEKDGVPVSPFHDIPLYANEQQTILNMVVEIPRWTNGKMEISKEEL